MLHHPTQPTETNPPIQTPSLDTTLDERLHTLLHNHYGYNSFRGNQSAIMKALIGGNDVFVRLPTGAGKSLPCILPALLSKGVAFIVSPLIALMEDQFTKLVDAKIPATILHSKVANKRDILHELQQEDCYFRIVLTTLEQLLSHAMSDVLYKMMENGNLAYFALDESHTLVLDAELRTAFQHVGKLRRIAPKTPIIAVTASATPEIEEEIKKVTNMKDPQVFSESVYRGNIRIEVRVKNQGRVFHQIATLIRTQFYRQVGIVYVLTTDECRGLQEFLVSVNLDATMYHGRLDNLIKTKNQRDWMGGRVPVMVATCAFGMGIDKLNVRYVAHVSIPHSMEAYYQQYGRVGRDGLDSSVITFYHPQDICRVVQLIATSIPMTILQKEKIIRLYQFQDYLQSTVKCRNAFILSYFGEEERTCDPKTNCLCDHCLTVTDCVTIDITREAKIVTVWLKSNPGFELHSFTSMLKGMQKQPETICSLFRHWSMPEIERVLRYLVRLRILKMYPAKHQNSPQIQVKVIV